MASPVCIKLHNIKMVKIKYEGKLYEVATSNFDNLLSDFQKHKPEVRQLLYARPLVAEDFEHLNADSVVYASADTSSHTEGNFLNTEAYQTGLPQLEYQSSLTNQNGHGMSTASTGLPQLMVGPTDATKLRSDLSMVDSFCSPPSVFIEAPSENEPIDTMDIAIRVRDVLERHKISQTLFSKHVIKRSQGTTSDLLRCPKQWDRMSEEGRVPYRRMKAWLEGDLQHNLQILLRIKQGLDVPAFFPKCNRTKFTDEQKEALELFLSQNPRLTHDTLEMFASEQNLTISAVRNWVNNRKQRMKRGSTTGLEEGNGKYSRLDSSDDVDDEVYQARSQEFDGSNFNRIENEGVPTMVTPFNQGNVNQTRVSAGYEGQSLNTVESTATTDNQTMVTTAPFSRNMLGQTRVVTEFEGPTLNEIGGNTIANVSTIAGGATSLKQENNIQKQCEYDGSTNLTVDCLGSVSSD